MSSMCVHSLFSFFFFNDTATTEIYTLSLHDALPISRGSPGVAGCGMAGAWLAAAGRRRAVRKSRPRSEEHTSELQSQSNLVCRLLLEKKKNHLTRDADDRRRLCHTKPVRRSNACHYL